MTMNVDTPLMTTAGGARSGPRHRFRTMRSYLRQPLGIAAAVFLILVVIAVILAPAIAPYSPLEQSLLNTLSGPSSDHLLGTDQLGRDVLSRLLYGGQVTLFGVLEAVLIADFLGIALGLTAGYFGGVADTVISRLTEIVMSVPAIVVLLMVYALNDNNADAGMIALGLLSVPSILRVTRGATRSMRAETFISASKVVGMGRLRILARHILPNIWGPIIVNTAILAAVTLGVQGGLNYLNLGVTPPAPSWGGMVSEAQTQLQLQPWLIVPSGLIIALTIMSFILIADSLRDATNSNLVRSQPAGKIRPQPEPTHSEMGTYPSRALLQVHNMSVSFGGVQVVREVTLEVEKGTSLGIVGESGCGKSVTASAILGSLSAGSKVTGRLIFDGIDLQHATKAERTAIRGRGIAYVSQDPMVSLDPSYTVMNQLGELVGRHDKLRGAKRRARVLELLTQVGLPKPAGVARRYPHQLSGGMAQRVSIACALAGRPRVLVADEPTTALDVTIQGEILGLLRRLRTETDLAIVLITHDLGVVADLCDRVVVMYAGEVIESTTVESLFSTPAHPYTRALIEANPIAAERGVPLQSIPGTVPAPRDWPTGCHFFERCAFAVPECAVGPIPLISVAEPGHDSRCIRTLELIGAHV